MRDLRRAPVVHFLVLGGLCLAVEHWLSAPRRVSAPIDRAPQLRDAAIDPLRQSIALDRDARAGAASPDRLAERIDDEVLYREGLALAETGRDPVIRRRL